VTRRYTAYQQPRGGVACINSLPLAYGRRV
jgi:hypothetical protein